ncbi:hypothetical protein KZZ52_58150 [Dactylosporangium sp. AC04546]|uniref:hypothetical protein n=1 Tax=Dactylosporangium sp. AC04546 TaxID=2862460 RepID=UPI001EDE75E4|nr:hypothetical protein [Dactylosporangium sp. AC04546]WVK83523.1 hypothetical protein KZZ52_58150 [Dactylosporangium sp. AC04546]
MEVAIGGEPAVMTTGYTPDGALCRVDLRAGVHGSVLAGVAEALATAITLGLQHGAPPSAYLNALRHMGRERPAVGSEDPDGQVLLDIFTGAPAER